MSEFWEGPVDGRDEVAVKGSWFESFLIKSNGSFFTSDVVTEFDDPLLL